MVFHASVENVKKYYLKDFPNDTKASIATRLLVPDHCDDSLDPYIYTDDLEKLWLSIQNAYEAQGGVFDDAFVKSYISAVYKSANPPPYHYINNTKREKLDKSIGDLCQKLSKLLKDNHLDIQWGYSCKDNFRGFYHDLTEEHDFGKEGVQYHSVSCLQMLRKVRLFTLDQIAHEAPRTEKSKKKENAVETIFIRNLGKYNSRVFKKPLLAVLSVAAHAVYHTKNRKDEDDIHNILNRISTDEGMPC